MCRVMQACEARGQESCQETQEELEGGREGMLKPVFLHLPSKHSHRQRWSDTSLPFKF